MKILGELFRPVSISFAEGADDSNVHFTAILKPMMDNNVFKAHFPGKPVVPGACLVGAAAELVADEVGAEWKLTCIKNVKFTSLIEPDEDTLVTMNVTVDKTTSNVKVLVSYNESIACKMSLVCTIA